MGGNVKDTDYVKVLTILSDGNWHLGDELASVTYRFSVYIHRAKSRGLKFERSRIGSKYAYRLASPKTEVKAVLSLISDAKVGRKRRTRR